MITNMQEYSRMLRESNIDISYSGPMWESSMTGIAEMVKESLSHDELTTKASKSVFSVFVEQVTNMLMYSADKERNGKNKKELAPKGMLALGHNEKTYFIQTGNAIKNESIDLVRSRIEHLNGLDKKELRQYYKERLRGDNDNPESKGAGLGLIEIARRSTAPIQYSFEPYGDGISYFIMYVEITQEES